MVLGKMNQYTFISEVKVIDRVMLSKDLLVSQELEMQINSIEESHFANFNIHAAGGDRKGLGREATYLLKLRVSLSPVGMLYQSNAAISRSTIENIYSNIATINENMDRMDRNILSIAKVLAENRKTADSHLAQLRTHEDQILRNS